MRFAAAVTGRTDLVLLRRTTDGLYTWPSERIGGLPGARTAETALTLRRVRALTHPHR